MLDLSENFIDDRSIKELSQSLLLTSTLEILIINSMAF